MRQIYALTVLTCLASFPTAARADVFNMPSGQTSVRFVNIGDPGNAADSTGYGAVNYVYQMDKYDVTIAQYTQFLNAVAATDTYGLYNAQMATAFPTLGITRSGSSGSYSYSAFGNVNVPVCYVSWGDASRFSNWLQNGQLIGAEGLGTTETGAYTLNGATTNAALMAITRNAGATYFIPSEDEWYKSAYYKRGGTNAGYWLYATQSNTLPSNVLSASGTNNASYHNTQGFSDPVNDLTSVGAFASSPSAYGTFDQDGVVWNWDETSISGSYRGLRGGDWYDDSGNLAASSRYYGVPTNEYFFGFRVASVSAIVLEPSSFALLGIGAVGFLIWARRRKASP